MENLLDILLDCWHEAGGVVLFFAALIAAYCLGRAFNGMKFWIQDFFSGRRG